MFLQFRKSNSTDNSTTSPLKQAIFNFAKQSSKQDRSNKINNLRNLYNCQTLNWHKPIQSFVSDLQNVNNNYSILLTLFEISQQPLWRNKIPHLCSLIKILHNKCTQGKGNYLSEIKNINNYHNKLCKIFYLNDNILQQHFKMLIMLYLHYNLKQAVFDEKEIALGLLKAGRSRTDNKLPEYLWIVSQITVDNRGILILLKYGAEIINQTQQQNLEIATQALIPIITSISNYIYYEKDHSVIFQLINSELFQQLLMHCLNQNINPDLSQQSILLCNNLLSKSPDFVQQIKSWPSLMSSIERQKGPQVEIWHQLISLGEEKTF